MFILIIFNSGFSTKLTCTFLLQKNILEVSELNTCKPRKNIIFHILDISEFCNALTCVFKTRAQTFPLLLETLKTVP